MTRNYAAESFAAFHEFATQAQSARIVEAATDGEAVRNAAVVEVGGEG